MPYDPIDIGTAANDGTGDKPREAAIKANAMFEELYGMFATRVPPAPSVGTATATSATTATITFTAPTGALSDTITSYRVYSGATLVATLSGGLPAAGDQGTINITGLAPETTYTFTIRAVNSDGQSLPSAASNSITTPAVATQYVFWGALDSPSPGPADILALSSSQETSRAKTVTDAISNDHFAYAYPASMGDLTTVYINGSTVFNQLAGFIKTMQTLTPPGGQPTLYNIYISEFEYLPTTVTHQFI